MAQKSIWKTSALPLLLVLILAGCATTIRVAIQRPPALNTAGIRRIAIMPFEADSDAYTEMAQYASSAAIEKIRALNYFTLIDSSEINRLQGNNQSIESHVEALFRGRVTRVGIENDAQQGSYKDKDGQTVTYTDYITKVEIEFNYSFVLARDGRLIGPVSRKGSNSASSRENYPASSALLRAAVDEQLKFLGRDVAPYTAFETRSFAAEKSKNDILKAEMKEALAQVKAGSYRTALGAYLGIYDRHKNIAAAENASILYESLGDTRAAADLMRRAYDETGNPRARERLARLNRILSDQATLASGYSDTRNQTDRAAAFAIGEIQKVLPQGSRVWVYNSAMTNPMAAAVADNITSDFLRKGIGVVDRQNAALIEAEQRFQMSGNVSDDDFLSIANAAGANIIVVVDITGTGAIRRLNIRVLNIERGVPIMQSDTSENWQL